MYHFCLTIYKQTYAIYVDLDKFFKFFFRDAEGSFVLGAKHFYLEILREASADIMLTHTG